MEMDIQAILWAFLCMLFGEHRGAFLLGGGVRVGLNLTGFKSHCGLNCIPLNCDK